MSVSICKKCQGPVSVEDGQYVCMVCGATYGAAPVQVKFDTKITRDYSTFFQNISLEEFRRLSNKLRDVVCIYREGGGDYNGYVVALLSNGQFFTRHILGEGFTSVYRGQCDVSNWFSVKSIYAGQDYSVAIGANGELQPTLIEVEGLFAEMKKSGISDMRIKQIAKVVYRRPPSIPYGEIEPEFLGLDMDGKVVVYNPFKVFYCKKTDEKDCEKLTRMLKAIKTWPPLKKLLKSDPLIGITEEGKVFAAGNVSLWGVREITNWDNIDDIIVCARNCTGLKKDGTLVEANNKFKNISTYKDIVQIAYHEEELAMLTRQGEFYIGGKKIDDNVVALLPDSRINCTIGYVRANGIVYELVGREGKKYTPIKNLKLFDNIETMEAEYEESEKGRALAKNRLEKERDSILSELQAKRKEVHALEMEYSELGLFKLKEKKALRAVIDERLCEQSRIEAKLDKVKDELLSIPNGRAAWHRIELPRYDSYSSSQLTAAAYDCGLKPKSGTSVIGSAAIGAVVAGPVGAVVGAIYAADKNSRNNK